MGKASVILDCDGDGDCGPGEIHTRAREISRRRNTKEARKFLGRSPRVASPPNFARKRMYFARPTIAIA